MERLEVAIKKARGQQADAQATPAAGEAGDPSAQPQVPAGLQETWTNLPQISLNRADLRRNRIFAHEASNEATAFDLLRTRTLRQMQEHGWRRLAITSPTPSCGKSTLAVNMALSLGRQEKIRTIEIEMDMRRPSQSRLLGLDKATGRTTEPAVARVITGKADFADVARRVGPNLAFVSNETAMRNASDILLDSNVGEILSEIEARYKPDVMLFDMPPVLYTDDTLAFMQHVDCALVIAAAESSTISEIDRCERELAAQTNVMGVVLNKCRLSNEKYGNYEYEY